MNRVWGGFRFLGLSGLGVSGFSVWGLRFSDFRVFLVLFFVGLGLICVQVNQVGEVLGFSGCRV